MDHYVTLEYLIKRYGEPVLRFKPHGSFTIQEKVNDPVPFECAIFRIKKSYEYVTCYRSRDNNNWEWGNDRFSIRELLRVINAPGS